MKERAAIYGRSSRDATGIGRSVDSQIADCRRWVEAEGAEVVVELRDVDRSAGKYAKKQREGFDELLRLVTTGAIDLLVAWEVSRLARNMPDYTRLREACDAHGVGWLIGGTRRAAGDQNAVLMDDLQLVMGTNESAKNRERIVRNVRQNAERGRPHGRVPYGYKRVYDLHSGHLVRQEPDPETAKVVREATAAVLRGVPFAAGVYSPEQGGRSESEAPTEEDCGGRLGHDLAARRLASDSAEAV
jgi:site-specific DNA recombinase